VGGFFFLERKVSEPTCELCMLVERLNFGSGSVVCEFAGERYACALDMGMVWGWIVILFRSCFVYM